MDIINTEILLFFASMLALCLIAQTVMPKAKSNELRVVPAIEQIIESVRICAEKGKPLLYSPAAVGLTGAFSGGFAPSILEVAKLVAKTAAELGVRVITTSTDTAFTVCLRDYVREGYSLGGNPAAYNDNDIHWMPYGSAITFGTLGIVQKEETGAHVMIGGWYWATGIPIMEIGARHKAFQIGGTASPEDTATFALGCDYVTLNEEICAAGAYLSRDKIQIASIIGSDWCKISIIGAIIVGGVLSLAGVTLWA